LACYRLLQPLEFGKERRPATPLTYPIPRVLPSFGKERRSDTPHSHHQDLSFFLREKRGGQPHSSLTLREKSLLSHPSPLSDSRLQSFGPRTTGFFLREERGGQPHFSLTLHLFRTPDSHLSDLGLRVSSFGKREDPSPPSDSLPSFGLGLRVSIKPLAG
jgi:hypothetical protein